MYARKPNVIRLMAYIKRSRNAVFFENNNPGDL